MKKFRLLSLELIKANTQDSLPPFSTPTMSRLLRYHQMSPQPLILRILSAPIPFAHVTLPLGWDARQWLGALH